MSLILGVDMGGTNCRLASFSLNQGRLILEQKLWLKTADLPTTAHFVRACKNFLEQPKAMVVAVAGPVQAAGAKVTNAELNLNLAELQAQFPQAQIINDFVAQAWAVLSPAGQEASLVKAGIDVEPAKTTEFSANPTSALKKNQIDSAQINFAQTSLAQASLPQNIGILGAGTGLGAANLYARQGQWYAMPSELGHSLFPFVGSEEVELQKFFSNKLQTWQINYDDVLTGRGLSLIHEFLSSQSLSAAEIGQKYLGQTEASVADSIEDNSIETNSILARSRLARSMTTKLTPHATLDWFGRFYARACRTWIMNSLCTNGLYLTGGIAAKNPALVQGDSFKQELMACKTNSELIAQTPIWLMSNPDSGLWGAGYVAAKLTSKNI